jgi:hypothetical protein
VEKEQRMRLTTTTTPTTIVITVVVVTKIMTTKQLVDPRKFASTWDGKYLQKVIYVTKLSSTLRHHNTHFLTSVMTLSLTRLTILLLGMVAFAFSVLTILSCSFFEHRSSSSSPASTTQATTIGFDVSAIGLFSFEMNMDTSTTTTTDNNGGVGLGFDDLDLDDITGSTCQSYNGKFLQPAPWMGTFWIVAQFASIIAPSLGSAACLLVLVESIVGKFRGSCLLPILLLISACLIQGCTFFMLGQLDVCFAGDVTEANNGVESTSPSCHLSYGSFMSISASFIYYLISVGLCCLPRPNPWCRRRTTKNNENNDDNQYGGHGGGDNKDATTSSDVETDEECPTSSTLNPNALNPSEGILSSSSSQPRYSWQQVS